MDGNHEVLDISSDENGSPVWSEIYGSHSEADWTELFLNLEKDYGDHSRNPDKDYDSDDVVILKEVLPKPKRIKNSSGVANLVREEDDDDCVILDGDPDKPLMLDENSAYDSDDLVVVAEKGQVACRDYPHPRHLCVQLPFCSTLHSEHCNMCHCYVCDSHAPCGNWGNGKLVTDHCHATEKEEFWESERKRIKERGNPPIVSLVEKPFSYSDILLHFPAPVPACVGLGQKSSELSKNGTYSSNQLYQQPIIPWNNFQKDEVSSLSSHAVTSSHILKKPRLLENANDLMVDHLASKQADTREIHKDNRHGDVQLLHPHQFTSEMNTSKRISSGQLYGQPTDEAIGNLNENISFSGTSNPQCNASHQNQSFAGASDLHGREQLPLMEEQSWNGRNSDLPVLERPHCQVLSKLSDMGAGCSWRDF